MPENERDTLPARVEAEAMDDELADDYEFDYAQAKPNRFAAGMQPGGRLVVLDPEVAEVFRESKTVNDALRALMKTMPPPHEAA